MERLQEICDSQYGPMQCNTTRAVDVSTDVLWYFLTERLKHMSDLICLFLQIFRSSVLFFREPEFHPLIREVIMNISCFTILPLCFSMLYVNR